MPYSSPESASGLATYSAFFAGPSSSSFTVTFTGDGSPSESVLDGIVQDFVDFVHASTDYTFTGGEKLYGTREGITAT